MEDGKIIDLYLSRNEEAISETKEKYGVKLKRISLNITGDGGAAEECENDLYLKVWNSIPPNEPREYFSAYLMKIIRNISLDFVRKRGSLKRNADISQLSSELCECIASPDDVFTLSDEKILREKLNSFIKNLPKERRNIFLRRYWFLDSINDISKRFGISQSKVKTVLYRTRNELKEALK